MIARLACGGALLLVAIAACGGPEDPDRVVNVLWVCDPSPRYDADFQQVIAGRITRGGCDSVGRGWLGNSILEVTVRTPQGGSYIVTLDPYSEPGASIEVGDPWPQAGE